MDSSTTTRPAGVGGIDISAIDLAAAIFNATGGGYGNPTTGTPSAEGTPTHPNDWFTNFGNGALVDTIDFTSPLPADKNAPIKLVAETDAKHPLMDLMAGDEKPDFANGGPEGQGIVIIIAAVAVVAAAALAAAYLAGAFDDKAPAAEKPAPKGEVDPETGIQVWENDYRDPDQVSDSLPSPAEMVASLLDQAGVKGIDPTSVGMTDLMGKLTDNMGKVADLIGALSNAAQSGDTAMFDGALADLMALAGLGDFDADLANASSQLVWDAMFEIYGIDGGLDGASHHEAQRQAEELAVIAEASQDQIATLVIWGDDFG